MNTGEVLTSPSFLDASWHHIRMILEMPYLSAPEISIFRAVQYWLSVKPPMNEKAVVSLLSHIRFPSLTVEQLQSEVVPSELLPYKVVVQILQHKNTVRDPWASDQLSMVGFNSQPREGGTDAELPPLVNTKSGSEQEAPDAKHHTLQISKSQFGNAAGMSPIALVSSLSISRGPQASQKAFVTGSPAFITGSPVHQDSSLPMMDQDHRIKESGPRDEEHDFLLSSKHQKRRSSRTMEILQDAHAVLQEASRPATGYASRPATGYDATKMKKPASRARGDERLRSSRDEGLRSSRLTRLGQSLAMPGREDASPWPNRLNNLSKDMAA